MVSPADSGACDSGPAFPMRKPRSGEKVRVLSALVYSAFKLLLLLSRFSRVRLCATSKTGSPPGSPVSGIPQARTLEWVAISSSNAWK